MSESLAVHRHVMIEQVDVDARLPSVPDEGYHETMEEGLLVKTMGQFESESMFDRQMEEDTPVRTHKSYSTRDKREEKK